MQNKLSYSHSNVHKTNLLRDEHCTVSFGKQCKVHRNPSTTDMSLYFVKFMTQWRLMVLKVDSVQNNN